MRLNRCGISFCAAASLLAFSPRVNAFAQEQSVAAAPEHAFFPRPELSSVHIENKDGILYVKALVNGKPATFYFDSLWGTDALTANAAKRLGLLPETASSSETGAKTIDRLQIGNFVRQNAPVAIIDSTGWEVDGILGAGLLKQAVVRVDFRNEQLTFLDPVTYTPSASAASAPLVMQRDGSVLVKGRVDNLDASFLVAVGDNNGLTLESTFAARTNFRDAYAEGIRVGSGNDADQIRVQYFHIGSFRIASPVVFVAKPEGDDFISTAAVDGKVGSNFLQRFLVTLDYPHQRLVLEHPDATVQVAKPGTTDDFGDAPATDSAALMDARLLLADYKKAFAQMQWMYGTDAAFNEFSTSDLVVTLRPFGKVTDTLNQTQFLKLFQERVTNRFGLAALSMLIVDDPNDDHRADRIPGMQLYHWRPDKIEIRPDALVVTTSPCTHPLEAWNNASNSRQTKSSMNDGGFQMRATFRNVYAKTDKGLRLKSAEMLGFAVSFEGHSVSNADSRDMLLSPIEVPK